MIWSDVDAVRLDAILDELIPANPQRDIPAAGAAGVADFLSDKAQTDAGFHAAVSSLLRLAAEMADEVTTDLVRQLEGKAPGDFNKLLTETYKGYYSQPDIRAKFGVGAHPVHPQGYDVERESAEMLAELTAPVVARGPLFRDVPGDA